VAVKWRAVLISARRKIFWKACFENFPDGKIRRGGSGGDVEERTDQGLIKEKIRVELRRFFRKRSGRRPLVVPVIMEV